MKRKKEKSLTRLMTVIKRNNSNKNLRGKSKIVRSSKKDKNRMHLKSIKRHRTSSSKRNKRRRENKWRNYKRKRK